MPKTKDGGFIIDDSSVVVSEKPIEKKPEPKK